ncbi:unnamed protein product, partial [Polarella glacialis]
AEHPQRDEVGTPLPRKDVPERMRSGKNNTFQFWRDLRVPFAVLDARRSDAGSQLQDGGGTKAHPDGDLYLVTYECQIEYFGERLWGLKSDGGSFNNRVHGVAKVRLPLGFPETRPLIIESWGRPVVNWTAMDDRNNP